MAAQWHKVQVSPETGYPGYTEYVLVENGRAEVIAKRIYTGIVEFQAVFPSDRPFIQVGDAVSPQLQESLDLLWSDKLDPSTRHILTRDNRVVDEASASTVVW